MIKITFPDNSVKEFAEGVSPLEIAKSLSNSLAKEVLSATFNGKEWDATRPINQDGTIKFNKYGKKDCRKSICWTNRTRKAINQKWNLKESQNVKYITLNNMRIYKNLPII